jgi:hypothetical protein
MEQKTPKPISLTSVISASAITCLLMGGALFVLHKKTLTTLSEMGYAQQEAVEKLNRRISALESQTRELAARPAPVTDTAPVEELRSGITEAKSTIASLTERLSEIEKKPASAPEPLIQETPASKALMVLKAAVTSGISYQAELDIWDKEHPKSANKAETLHALATAGVPTETKLRDSLRTTINHYSEGSAAFPDQSVAGRLNTHLSSFISIKKKTVLAPELQQLREATDNAPLSQLEAQIKSLPDTLKPLFTEWLQTLANRTKALAELNQLDSTP